MKLDEKTWSRWERHANQIVDDLRSTVNDQPLWQTSTFRSLSEDGEVLSRSLIQHDQEQLREISEKVQEFADRQLAHLDKRGFEGRLTFEPGTSNSLAFT